MTTMVAATRRGDRLRLSEITIREAAFCSVVWRRRLAIKCVTDTDVLRASEVS